MAEQIPLKKAIAARSQRNKHSKTTSCNHSGPIERMPQAQARSLDKISGNQVYIETKDGEVVPAFTFEPNALLKGTEQLGRAFEMFTDKWKTPVKGRVVLIISPESPVEFIDHQIRPK